MNCFLFPLFFLFLKRETKNEKKNEETRMERIQKKDEKTQIVSHNNRSRIMNEVTDDTPNEVLFFFFFFYYFYPFLFLKNENDTLLDTHKRITSLYSRYKIRERLYLTAR